MSNISLDLSNKLPAEQVNIIRHVVRAAETHQLRIFIVGAQARDLMLQYVYELPVHRATNDIDFVVIVESWDEFTKLRDDLIVDKKFQPHRTMTQRLVHENELLIDLVPFGGLEEVRGQISWPPDFSIIMRTAGFAEAYDNSVEICISDDLIVKVASLAGLALMKIVAWDERRFQRDAEDLGLVMRHYLDAGNQDRIYTEEGDCFDLLDEEFDYERASARILGRDVGRLLTRTSRLIVERVLSKEPDQANLDALTTVMIANSTNYNRDYEMALSMLMELRTGIAETDGS